MDQMRICGGECHKSKPQHEFYSKGEGAFDSYCKSCRLAYKKRKRMLKSQTTDKTLECQYPEDIVSDVVIPSQNAGAPTSYSLWSKAYGRDVPVHELKVIESRLLNLALILREVS